MEEQQEQQKGREGQGAVVSAAESAEIHRLRQEVLEQRRLLQEKEEQIYWYARKLKESLVSLHASAMREKNGAAREAELIAGRERRYEHFLIEYNNMGRELTRLRKFNPERLPIFLKLPLKALIVALAEGPFETMRVARRKRRGEMSIGDNVP